MPVKWGLFFLLLLCFLAATTEVFPFWFNLSRVGYFLDAPSLFLTVASTAVLTLTCHSQQTSNAALRSIIATRHVLERDEALRAAAFWKTFARNSMHMGWFWTLFGLITVGMELKDMQILGLAAAVSVLPLLYGLLFSSVARTAADKLRHFGKGEIHSSPAKAGSLPHTVPPSDTQYHGSMLSSHPE